MLRQCDGGADRGRGRPAAPRVCRRGAGQPWPGNRGALRGAQHPMRPTADSVL